MEKWLRLLLFLYVVLMSSACMLDAKIYGTSSPSLKIIEAGELSLLNVPYKASPSTRLKTNVVSSTFSFYKYKIGPAISTECSSESEYSNSAIPISTPITDDLSSFSDQLMRLCVVGAKPDEQFNFSQAIAHSWYLDRIPTVISLGGGDQVASESDGSNKTFVVSSSVTKPYSIEVDYKILGDASYMLDHNLPESGKIIIPENTNSVNVTFQTIHNINSNQSKLVQFNILKSDNLASLIGFTYTQRFFINDVDLSSRPTIQSLVVGSSSSCAILSTGTLRCWGGNAYGQIGDGTLVAKLTPVTIDSGTSYSQVVMAGGSTCGITSTGVLKCWGRNNVGQLGDGTLVDKLSPVVIDPGVAYSKIKMFSATNTTTCGVTTTGILKCWGYNNRGQVGDGTTVDKSSPAIVNSGTNYSDVEMGTWMACGLVASTGVLKCWGASSGGQIGDGVVADRSSPVVVNSGTSYSKISTHSNTVCGIVVTTRVLKCWGLNSWGGVGDGTTTNKNSPTVIDSGVQYIDVITSGNTTCGITSNNDLKCWGYNVNGQLGDGTTVSKNLPSLIDSGTKYVKILPNSNGNGVTCGIVATTFALKCWGSNSSGQLGDGTTVSRLTPKNIDTGVGYFSIAHANGTTCGITSSKEEIKCWGINLNGALGDGTNSFKLTPIIADPGITYKDLVSHGAVTCGLTAMDTIRCWGRGHLGQLGNGTDQSDYRPSDVDGDVKYSQLKLFNDTVCGITLDGVLKCWGNNSFGQVGDGTTVNRLIPEIIDPGTTYAFVEPNNNSTCGITTSGVLKCWGNNSNSQLGDGTTVQRNTPVIIDPGVSYRYVIPTSSASCGITTDDVLKCWGLNTNGQVGDNTIVTKSIPTVIDNGTKYSHVMSSHLNTTCGITSAGVLKCWGYNIYGMVGDGTTTQKNIPTVVDSGTPYKYIGPSFYSTCGITTAGLLKCWGLGTNGTIGDGNLAHRYTPTRVADSGTLFTSALVIYNGCGITSSGDLKCWGPNNNGQVGDGSTFTRLAPTLIDGSSKYKKISHGGFGTTCALTTNGIVKCWGNSNVGQAGDSPSDIIPFLPRNITKWVVP